MKISELAERTRVPKETIHYYLREGVLRKPRKTGKNIADYNENYVEQIRIIKQLQEHYFLPLSVIKKIIRRHQKQSPSEKYSLNFLSEYFRPLDRLIAAAVTGKRSLSGEPPACRRNGWANSKNGASSVSKCTRAGRCMLRTTSFSAN